MAQANAAGPPWPPRSPYEALLSSPSGRKKIRDLQSRTSPTPSPSKRIGLGLSTRTPRKLLREELEVEDHTISDEDEETLQLKLQAIEAKLKLKKLHQAKSKNVVAELEAPASPNNDARTPAVSSKAAARHVGTGGDHPSRTKLAQDVQVPLSPPERKKVIQETRSPGRVRLGIDKGLTARDVSLRRPPTQPESNSSRSPLKRSGTENRHQHRGLVTDSQRYDAPLMEDIKPKSFSERIAELRSHDRNRKDRQDQIRKKRSKGFGIAAEELEASKKMVTANHDDVDDDDEDPFLVEARRSKPREFTRAEVLQAYNQPDGHLVKRNKTMSDLRAGIIKGESSEVKDTGHSRLPPSDAAATRQHSKEPQQTPSQKAEHGQDASSLDSSLLEPFSGFHLSKRLLPHTLLRRTFSDKKTFHIPDLLKTVKSPSYDAPDIEEDWVVLAIIASKSTPRTHKDDHRKTSSSSSTNKDNEANNDTSSRGKYMVLSLTDLKWELELFLFGTAFDRFWKLSPGTVIAVLNPNVMPPPPAKRDTGRFSLTLTSSDDTVLEIGTSRDLGFCKSVKRDGSICSQWVDKRHTEFCAFHVDVSVRKTKAGRMEVNTMSSAPFGPGGSSNRGGFSRLSSSRGNNNNKATKDDGLRKEGLYHDRSTNSQIFIAGPIPSGHAHGRSTASLLDDEDVDPDAFHRGYTKQERLRRQLATQERERKIARLLGREGKGMGGTYLCAFTAGYGGDGHARSHERASTSSLSSSSKAVAARPSEKAIGRESAGTKTGKEKEVEAEGTLLLDLNRRRHAKAENVRLSPLKRKHVSTVDTTPVGWGGALKRGLLDTTPSASITSSRPLQDGDGQTVRRERKRMRVGDGPAGAAGGGGGGGISNKAPPHDVNANANNNDDDDDDELEII